MSMKTIGEGIFKIPLNTVMPETGHVTPSPKQKTFWVTIQLL